MQFYEQNYQMLPPAGLMTISLTRPLVKAFDNKSLDDINDHFQACLHKVSTETQ